MKAPNPTTQRPWAGFAFVAIATVAIAFAMGRGAWQSGSLVAVHERKPMPLIELRQLDGGIWKLAAHRGQVVVINYWASWCAPCWEETPVLVRLSQEMNASGLAVVAVAMDEGSPEHVSAEVHRFVQALHVTYPIALQAPMSQMGYGMDGLPTTILADRNGRAARIYVGAIREKDIKADIEALLAEAGPPSDQALGSSASPK